MMEKFSSGDSRRTRERKATKSEIREKQVGSSEFLVQEGKDEKAEPLLASSSAATLGSFDDTDDSSEIAVLLAVGEGADLMPHTTHYSTDDIWTHMP